MQIEPLGGPWHGLGLSVAWVPSFQREVGHGLGRWRYQGILTPAPSPLPSGAEVGEAKTSRSRGTPARACGVALASNEPLPGERFQSEGAQPF